MSFIRGVFFTEGLKHFFNSRFLNANWHRELAEIVCCENEKVDLNSRFMQYCVIPRDRPGVTYTCISLNRVMIPKKYEGYERRVLHVENFLYDRGYFYEKCEKNFERPELDHVEFKVY